MTGFIETVIQFGLAPTIMSLTVLLPIWTLAIIKMIKKLRRLNEQIIFMVAVLLLALIDLNSTVLPDKK